jgi:2-oxoisovalerate dehydrogenase E1 component
MTKVFDDAMTAQADVVYIGEDVQHGGYYMVTDGLDKKHPGRVQDFPPDETSLVGVGMGYRHSGLLPIVEIPYAKYLDCAMDMFTEACVMNFLSNGKQPNGMIFRLQGFGRGVFGGNYHTHNMLHMPPGLDVVCYSNGRDYARGMRYAIQQARGGRVSMFVDSTELLNLREVQKGVSWEMAYTPSTEFCTYDDVFVYRGNAVHEATQVAAKRTLIVTYGNGVPLALQAQGQLQFGREIDVCDCPLLSSVPAGLDALIASGAYDRVLFADVCKEGQNPLSSHMVILMNRGRLGNHSIKARCMAASRTYNPLGNTLTFLNLNDVVQGVNDL